MVDDVVDFQKLPFPRRIAPVSYTHLDVYKRQRKSNAYGSPAETVTAKKQNRIAKAALMYIKANRLQNRHVRFDIVSIQNENISHLENAFAPTGYIY